MKSLQFSPRRFWLTLVWTLNYQRRTLLTLLVSAVTAFALYQYFTFIDLKNDIHYRQFYGHDIDAYIATRLDQTALASLAIGAALMCVGASIAFWHLHRQNEGRRLLMLPASPAEKFLARWVLYVPVLLVMLVAAFLAGDVLRVLTWPLFGYDVSFPSAIPAFFTQLKYLFFVTPTARPLGVLALWALFLFFHALSLFCSVWLPRLAQLVVVVVFFAVITLIENAIGNAATLHLWPFAALTVVLAVGAFWLFCRYPQYQLFHSKKD